MEQKKKKKKKALKENAEIKYRLRLRLARPVHDVTLKCSVTFYGTRCGVLHTFFVICCFSGEDINAINYTSTMKWNAFKSLNENSLHMCVCVNSVVLQNTHQAPGSNRDPPLAELSELQRRARACCNYM